MKEAKNLGPGGGDDIFGKGGEGCLASTTSVSYRGHPLLYPGDIRLNRNLMNTVENMTVHVNKPWSNELIFGINYLLALG
ncbi:hypothetical protein ES703_54506 [subsurface metagenome]